MKKNNSRNQFQVVSFAPFGLGAVICNAIIIISIVANNSLRKRREFRIINALAFADFVEGKIVKYLGFLFCFCRFCVFCH